MTNIEIKNSEAQAFKRSVKAVGEALKAKGHAVPHSVLLHAMSSALGATTWHVLKDKLAGPQAPHPVQKELPEMTSRETRMFRLAQFYGARVWQQEDSSWTFSFERKEGRHSREVIGDTFPRVLPAAHAAIAAAAGAQGMGGLSSGYLCLDGVCRLQLNGTGWNAPATLNIAKSALEGLDDWEFPGETLTFTLRNAQSQVLEFEGSCSQEGDRWALTQRGIDAVDKKLAELFGAKESSTVPQNTPSSGAVEMVRSSFTSDDHVVNFSFNAVPWMESAEDDELQKVFECGFGSGYACDVIAYWMEAAHNADFEAGFRYINAQQEHRDMGFCVQVDPEQFCRWLKEHRPVVFHRCMGSYGSVQVVQDESRPSAKDVFQWDAADKEARFISHGFRSPAEALADACDVLELWPQFCRDHKFNVN